VQREPSAYGADPDSDFDPEEKKSKNTDSTGHSFSEPDGRIKNSLSQRTQPSFHPEMALFQFNGVNFRNYSITY
jgi:hypothetical protein